MTTSIDFKIQRYAEKEHNQLTELCNQRDLLQQRLAKRNHDQVLKFSFCAIDKLKSEVETDQSGEVTKRPMAPEQVSVYIMILNKALFSFNLGYNVLLEHSKVVETGADTDSMSPCGPEEFGKFK